MVFYREPEATRKTAKQVPLRLLLRSRFLWQFTLSKVFSDPVWYFYTFWFPQYLKVVHGFSLRQIGETGWIPFFTAALGNIAGGAVFSTLNRTVGEAATTRRIAVLLFSVLMIPAVLVSGNLSAAACIGLISIATFGYAGALANLLAIPGDAFPSDIVASVWGFASVGSGVGGHGVLTGYRLACGPLFFSSHVRSIRNPPGDLRVDCLEAAATDASGSHVRVGRLDDPHAHATVDRNILPRDEVIFNERLDQLGDIIGLAFPAQWNAVANVD